MVEFISRPTINFREINDLIQLTVSQNCIESRKSVDRRFENKTAINLANKVVKHLLLSYHVWMPTPKLNFRNARFRIRRNPLP